MIASLQKKSSLLPSCASHLLPLGEVGRGYLLSLLLLLLCFAPAHAENYPYRSDFLWVTTPDHSDWLYRCGEKATVEVQLYKYGVAVADAELAYEIAPDMLRSDLYTVVASGAANKGKARLKAGKAVIPIGTRKSPGFLDLQLSATVDGMKTSHHVKVGYDAENIKPFTQMPSDFDHFWQQTVSKARKEVPTERYQQGGGFTRQLAPEYCTDKIDCWLIKLQTDREHYMYGYLTMPKDHKGKMPAVLCPPGAGVKTIKEPLRHSYYAENGMIRFEVEIHGLDPRFSETQFKEISNAFGGYLSNGLDSKERYYMKHVYAGMVRCMDFLTSLPEWDGRNLAVQGGSQGGALALVTAGLDPRVTLCVANHPALTDMAAYSEKGRTGGYPHFMNASPDGAAGNNLLTKQTIGVLAYFDVINFCRKVTCPVRLTWGYNDITCPPTTSFAAWNVLTSPKEAFITPINEHWTSNSMERQHMEWIKSKLK